MIKIIEGKDLVNMQFIETKDGLLKRYERKGKFVPEIEQTYWFIDKHGNINDYSYDNDVWDEWILKYNPVFETQEDCEEYKEYLIALDKYSYDFSQEEWKNENIYKYYLYFRFDYKTIQIGSHVIHRYACCYFKSEEDISSFISEVGEEAIERYMFGYYR